MTYSTLRTHSMLDTASRDSCIAAADDEGLLLVVVVHRVRDAAVHRQVDGRELTGRCGGDANDGVDVVGDRLVAAARHHQHR